MSKIIIFDCFGTLITPPNDAGPNPYIRLGHDRSLRRQFLTRDLSIEDFAKGLGKEELIPVLRAELDAQLCGVSLYSDVKGWLTCLRKWGFRIGLCSNLASDFGPRVKELLPGLDAYVFSYEVGAMKPEPAIYEAVCRALDCNPEDVIFIGNSQKADVDGPASYGMSSCLVSMGKGDNSMSAVLSNVAGGLLREMFRGLTPFNNRVEIERSGNAICYHCLNWFHSERIEKWTDEGITAICPICGIDAVLAQNADQPISIEWLIDYWKDEFSIDGLPHEHEIAKIREQIEKIDKQKEQLANDLPGFLSENYPLFVETMQFHWEGVTMTDLAGWMLHGQGERLKLLLSGNEKVIFKQLLEAEAGVCA